MAAPSWDARAQFEALLARKRHEETLLALSGTVLALASTVLLAELLSINEDTNTFLVLCLLNLGMLLGWIVLARRVGLAARRWAGRARGLEKEVLRIPSLYALWEESERDTPPAWVAAGLLVVALTVFWFGLLVYVVWVSFLAA